MTRGKKRFIIIVSVALALLCAELGREYVAFRMNSNKLEGGYWRINGRTGMTKEQVREAIGEPDVILPGDAEENWYWDAGRHKGPLLRLVRPGKAYVLNARFDPEGRMIDVYSETSIVTR
jgi:hypothetical protein